MVTTLRALLSVTMLIGFFGVALVQLLGAGALAHWLNSAVHGIVALKLTLPLFLALVGGVGVATWRAIRARHVPLPGVTLAPEQAPALWAEVRDLARAAGTRSPDELRIVGVVNAAVTEDTRLMGLIAGRRTLYIGFPLLQALSVSQLRAVVAHEMGHYSGSHTRLGAVAYRGRLAIAGTLGRISRWNPTSWVFHLYGLLFVLVGNAVTRRQEFEADAAAVRVAGKSAAIGALTEVHVTALAYDFYLQRYVSSGAEYGLLPDNVFARFGALVAARGDELTKLRAKVPAEAGGGLWDTHPPLSARISAIGDLPDPGTPDDPRPAVVLLPDADGVSLALHDLVVETRGHRVLPWTEFAAATASARLQAEADAVFREVGRRLGVTGVGLPEVMRALADGRAGELGTAFDEDFSVPLELLLALAALRSGVVSWRTSMAGPAELVTGDGAVLELRCAARLAVSPETLPQALEMLAALGIRVDAAAVVERRATVRGAEVVGGLANVDVGGVGTDVFVLSNGLVLMPADSDRHKGRERMLEVVRGTSLDELARRHRFVPYEEVRSASVVRETPLRAVLELHDGQTVELRETWSGELLTRDSRTTLIKIFNEFE